MALGKKHRQNRLDAIPVAAIVNAVGRDQIFCAKYSFEQKEAGIGRIEGKCNELFADPKRPGIMFLDRNPVLFDDNKEGKWKTIHLWLRHSFGNDLERVLNIRDEIYVYQHRKNPLHAILVHGSLCLASSSIEGVTDEQRVNRGLTAGILCNVQRFVNGLDFLSSEVNHGNVVEAMVAHQIYKNGFHGGLRQAAAFFRHFCRFDESVKPLTENQLGKITGPVPTSLRFTSNVRKSAEVKIRTTKDDHKVIKQARRLLCNHRDLKGRCDDKEAAREVMGPIYTELVELIHKPGSPEHVRKRLDCLIKYHFKKDSFFPELINEQYEKRRKNSGNPTATWHSRQQIKDNNVAFNNLIKNFAPASGESRGNSFWIRTGTISDRQFKQVGWAMHDCISTWKLIETGFPGSCEDLFQNLVYSSLVGRLKPKPLKNETDHARATRHVQYGLSVDRVIGIDNENTLWTLVHLEWK